MLTPPGLAATTIIGCLHDHYGLRISQVIFLPIGADTNSAVYRIDADDDTSYFLKLRRGHFDEVTVAVPAFLHAKDIRQVIAPIATITDQLWVHAHGFDWILYPFFEGQNGYEVALSESQWGALGESMRAVHTTHVPGGLRSRLRREAFAPRWRRIV